MGPKGSFDNGILALSWRAWPGDEKPKSCTGGVSTLEPPPIPPMFAEPPRSPRKDGSYENEPVFGAANASVEVVEPLFRLRISMASEFVLPGRKKVSTDCSSGSHGHRLAVTGRFVIASVGGVSKITSPILG